LSYRFTLPRWAWPAFRPTRPKRRRCFSPTSATAFTTRAPARTFDSRGDVRAFALTARPLEPKPQRTSRAATHLTVRQPASDGSTTLPTSSDAVTGAVRSWRGLSIDGPLGRRPFVAVCSTANEEEEPASDAPCRDAPGPKPLDAARTVSTASSSKETASSIRSAFPRRVPARRSAFANRLGREPATVPRARPPEIGFRRSFALRCIEEGLDPAASASSSLAGARRHAPLVDFCYRNVPQARPTNRGNPRPCARTSSFRPLRDPREGSPSPFRAAKPSGHGSGAECRRRFRFRLQLLPTRLRAPRAWPQPDWLGHLMSRIRDLVGRRGQLDRSNPPDDRPAFTETLAPEARLRVASRKGRLPHAPAKRRTFRRTQGAFRRRTSPPGRASSPHSVPSLWSGGLVPLQSSLTPTH